MGEWAFHCSARFLTWIIDKTWQVTRSYKLEGFHDRGKEVRRFLISTDPEKKKKKISNTKRKTKWIRKVEDF